MNAIKARKAALSAAAAMSRIANVSVVLHQEEDDDAAAAAAADALAEEIPDEINRQQLRAVAALIDAKGFPVEGAYEDSETRQQHRRAEKRKTQRAFADSPPDAAQQQEPAAKKPAHVVIVANDDDEDGDTIPEHPVACDHGCASNTSAYSDRLRVLFKSVSDKVAIFEAPRVAPPKTARVAPSPLALQIADVQKKIHERLDAVDDWIVSLEKLQALEASIQRDSAELSRTLLELRKRCE